MRISFEMCILRVLFISVIVMATGCTINHPVAQDYHSYLDNDKYPKSLPKCDIDASYRIDDETQVHRYEFRAGSVGYANLWIVEFGKILDETLNEGYVQQAFGHLDKASTTNNSEGLLTFELKEYEFKNSQAYVTMQVMLEENGFTILDKDYSAVGVNQAGKMWSLGVFAMTNATLQSTKFAIDDILAQLIIDINEAKGSDLSLAK